ncbi:TPA: hypothetical protein RG048_000030 [Proteus mirabilis]|nr:hypothetical protein [Proteus mirabilis]
MSTIPTQNPVPSEAASDLKYNSGKIDEFVTSMKNKYIDRFGQEHFTIEGLRWVAQQAISQFGYITLDSFQKGAEITLPNQVLRDEATGEYYRWDGALPKSVQIGSTPDSSGGIGIGKWLSVGDATLKKDVDDVIYRVGSSPITFKNVAELQASNLNVGDISRTLGLRNPNDGGGTVYRIISSQGTRPEGKGYKVTEYPFEYGDVRIANGNIAKRVTSVKKPDKVKFWAHRGGQREFAENTMFAFSQAIDNGAYGVELDLSMSSDGIWHVYHDASLYILTNGTDYIYNRDSEYLRGLTFNKLKNTKYADLIKIPTFSEFLFWAKENNIQFSAEFKNPRPGMVDEDIRAGIQMIVDSGCELQSIVQVTTNIEAMRVREVSNNIIISWSVTNLDASSIELYKDYNGLYMQTFSKNLNSNSSNAIKLIHALGYEVVVYTDGNKQDDIINSIAYGVDHIISDRGFEVNKS